MAELPEILRISSQMNESLSGKRIEALSIYQPKCANIEPGEFERRVKGQRIEGVRHKGKWIFLSLSGGENILLSLGMGADVLYFEEGRKSGGKHQIFLLLEDQSGFTIRFWWFGHFLCVNDEMLKAEKNTSAIAPDPFDRRFTPAYFTNLIRGKKGQVKAFLMDQKNVGGIGNAYMHDILFEAGIHPQKKLAELADEEIDALYLAMRSVLKRSLDKGAASYEPDFYGEKGAFGAEDMLVGYKEDAPCPKCSTPIVKLKTGPTHTFLCPNCQKL